MQERIQAVWETSILVWEIKLWCPNNTFQMFFFFSVLFEKYVKVAINDFAMHQIISKWLRRQRCRQKRKTMRQKDVEAKEETAYDSAFIYLKCNRS